MKLGPFTLGYNATVDKGRRQAPKRNVLHESEVLKPKDRNRLQATAQEQIRNHSLVAWMVRKHLDYISQFHFGFRTGNTEVDSLVNRIFKWHGKPRNFDFCQRLGREETFRLFELEKVVSGDAALLKLDGLKLQAIESDLIAKGTDAPDKVDASGLTLDNGKVLQYCICKRGTNGSTPLFDHLEDAENVIFDAYWTRFSSQFRGISPLSTAINMVQDIHEGFEFNLVKGKMHALFGLAITRNAEGTDGGFGPAGGASAETGGTETDATGTQLDINPRAINMLDLNPGEDVKVVESGTPSNEFVNGSYLFIQIAMLALDIPVTSFDSRRSSFSGRIADLNEYEVSSESKRTKNRYVRQDYSDWVLSEIWNDAASPWNLRQVCTGAKMTLRDIQEEVEWIAHGSPWLDKYNQIQGDKLAISICLDNAIDACRRKGGSVFDNIDKQAKVIAYAKEKGVPILVGDPGARTIEEAAMDEQIKARDAEDAANQEGQGQNGN
jgi:capsid protein